MSKNKAMRFLILVIFLFLQACGRAAPDTPTATAEKVMELAPTALPEATSTPAELPAPEPTADPNTVVPGGTVTIGLPREPEVVGPLMANETMERLIGWFILEGLVELDAEGNPVPVLAEALPDVSEDGLILTYPLKKGVKFSNGDPFTCADIQFTWKAVMSYQTPISKAGYELIKAIDCPDETTAVVSFGQGYPQYLNLFSFILPQASGSLDSITRWDHKTPIGTGPWMIWEWQVGDHLLLARNPHFREAGKPYLEYILLKFMRYQEKNISLLLEGEADIIWGLGESHLPALDDMASQGVSYSSAESGVNELLVFNLADPKYDAPTDPAINPHPILSDARVRQAIQFGIDKTNLTSALLPEGVQVSNSVMPASTLACPEPPGTYDPEKAMGLLEEAGWKPGADGIREREGVRLSLKFTTETGSEFRLKIQEALVAQMKAIGVELVVENLSPAQFNAGWKAGGIRRHGRFDILLVDSGQGATPGVSLKRQFHSARIPTAYNQGEGGNFSRYKNPEVDAWLDQALGSTSSQQQQEFLCQAVERVNQDLPVIPLYEHLVVNAYLSRLQNFAVSTGPANFTFGSQDWWLRP